MPTREDFAQSEIISVPSFSKALEICRDLRKKDLLKPYILSFDEGVSLGNFIFPYSHFYLLAKKGHVVQGDFMALFDVIEKRNPVDDFTLMAIS